MNEQKIAEIICPDTRRESCDSCQRHYSIGECAKAKQIEAILALIEQEQAEAFNEGVANALPIAHAQVKQELVEPMVEALKIARGHLDCGWIELAKKAIDAVLKGEGK